MLRISRVRILFRIVQNIFQNIFEGAGNKMLMASSRQGLTDADGGEGGFLGCARWCRGVPAWKKEKCSGLMAAWSQGAGLPCIEAFCCTFIFADDKSRRGSLLRKC